MFRHRKRLISKRLNRLMTLKNQKAMKAMFANFIHSRASHLQTLSSQHSQQPHQPASQSSQSIEEEQPINFQEDQEEDIQNSESFSISNYVATLSPHQKKIFQQQNPELPETFFMTKKQKQKYFSLKAQKYQNLLKNTPTRKSKTSKQVQFKEKFLFKPFNQFEKVTEVKKAKENQSFYSSKIHFS